MDNCAIYISANVCKKCLDGYGFKQDGDNVDCVALDIEHCQKYDLSFYHPFKCLTCEKGYYIDSEMKCVEVETQIDFCEIYQDENHCDKCESQKALSEAKEGCFASRYVMSKTDLYCDQSFMRSLPKCEVCEYGHYWKNDQCQPCLAQTPESGCMFCDPSNKYLCLMCMSGFYMNDNYSCIRLPQEIVSEESHVYILSIIFLNILLYCF